MCVCVCVCVCVGDGMSSGEEEEEVCVCWGGISGFCKVFTASLSPIGGSSEN